MNTKAETLLVKIVSAMGLVAFFSLLPPVFARVFAVLPLSSGEKLFLWAICIGLIAIIALLNIVSFRGKIQSSLLLVSLFCFLGLELTARLTVNRIKPEWRKASAKQALGLYPNWWRFKGHPFLQLVGNQNYIFQPDWVNKLGFYGKLYPREKDSTALRVVTLGSSTTTSGYPEQMETLLNNRLKSSKNKFEVLNFGGDGFTSAHCLIAYLLNGIDYSPNYVVIHTGATDEYVRNFGDKFRNDYSHAVKPFAPPGLLDGALVQTSVIYRALRDKILPRGGLYYLHEATRIPTKQPHDADYSNKSELYPYERNIRSIIDLSLTKGIHPVLTTIPFSTKPPVKRKKHYVQINQIIKKVASQYKNKLTFIDLDKALSIPHKDLFGDEIHFYPKGINIKAELIGKAIYQHWSTRKLKNRPLLLSSHFKTRNE